MRTRHAGAIAVVVLSVVAVGILVGTGGERAGTDRAGGPAAEECVHDHASDRCSETESARENPGASAGSHEGHDHGEGDVSHESSAPDGEEHGDHLHGENTSVVTLSRREVEECGVSVMVAGPGRLERRITLPGEVRLNGDRMVHMVPRVPGVVVDVRKTLGDVVKAGEVLAVVESNELADASAGFMAARERLALAEATFGREQNLWDKGITSEQDYLTARREVTEARIEYRSREQKLFALGLTDRDVAALTADGDAVLTRYEVRAPLAGTVVEKHVTLGERVDDQSEIFLIADLGTVWVDLSVAQKDFPFVNRGAEVRISAGHGVPDASGTIDYVSPVIGEATRTATARVILPNPDGVYKPGLFVSASVSAAEADAPVVIPRTAAQQLDEEWVVFVEAAGGFEPVPVTLGRADDGRVEVVAGIQPGQRYVAEGAFECKAKVVTSSIDPHAGHGH